jgi:hypothetical protein
VGKKVFDMSCFHELESTHFYKRNVSLVKLDLQVKGMIAGSKQDRNFIEGNPFLAEFKDPLTHKP